MDNEKDQMLNMIKSVYDQCKATYVDNKEELLKSILETKFHEIDRITFHGTIDIVINLEMKHCKDNVKSEDTKQLQVQMKGIDTLIQKSQKQECSNMHLARNLFCENLKNIIRHVSDMDVEAIRREYFKSVDIYQPIEYECVSKIINLEHQRYTKKEKKLKAFLGKHQNIYWPGFGCTDFSSPMRYYETVHDFLENFPIEYNKIKDVLLITE